jgi:hypothetical protein
LIVFANAVIKGYSPELMVTPVYELSWKELDDSNGGQTGAVSLKIKTNLLKYCAVCYTTVT